MVINAAGIFTEADSVSSLKLINHTFPPEPMYTLQKTLRKSGWVWALLAAGLIQGMIVLSIVPNQSPNSASRIPSPVRVNR